MSDRATEGQVNKAKNEAIRPETNEKGHKETSPEQFEMAAKVLTGAIQANTRREMAIVLVRGIVQLKYSQLRNTLRTVGLDPQDIRQADFIGPSLLQLLTYADRTSDIMAKLGKVKDVRCQIFEEPGSIAVEELFPRDVQHMPTEMEVNEKTRLICKARWEKLAESPYPSVKGFWQRQLRRLAAVAPKTTIISEPDQQCSMTVMTVDTPEKEPPPDVEMAEN